MDNKKINNDHSFVAETWEFSSWTDDLGNTHDIKDSIEEIPEEEFTDFVEEEFIYFKDENVRRYSEDSLESRYLRHYSDPDNGEGSIIVRAPSKMSWPTIASVIAVAINILIAGSAFYFTQSGFNEKVIDKLNTLETNQKEIIANVYTKREVDLSRENAYIQIQRNDEAIKRLQNKLGD